MRTRSIILGYVALILLLTAGAAQSLSGSNTVFTDDIAPGAVNFSDIHENAVTSSRIAPGSVFGSDIANNAVTGTDINEASIPGFKKVYTTRIRSTGTEQSGDATAATKLVTGSYRVTFGFNVSPCSAHATPSNFLDFGGFTFGSFAHAGTSNIANTPDILVFTWRVSGGSTVGIDTSFVLTLVCP